jgi:hypothetical protein
MSKEFQFRPQPSKQPEQHKLQQEGGNGAPGLPPDSRAYPTLPQKSALNRAVERTYALYERNGWVFLPLGVTAKDSIVTPNIQSPSSEDEQNECIIANEGETSKVTLYQGREDKKMPRMTSPTPDHSLPISENKPLSPDELTSQERERQEIEASVSTLKQLRTMSQRIDHATGINLEHLHKLWQHNPAFMRPVLKGLVRRPDRLAQKERLKYRLTEGDLSPKCKPDYTDLGFSLDEWYYFKHPEQFPELFKNTRLLEAQQAVAYAVDRAGDEDCDELVGLKNALVCMHDLLRDLQDAGVKPPGIYARVHRRLERRRAYLDPDHSKDGQH